MITDKTHSKKWFESLMVKFSRRDPGLIERVVKALTLLEQLIDCGLDGFVFKGGTSLILLLENTKRFSVDIDLCIDKKPENLNEIFNKIKKKGIFTRWEEDERIPRPPMEKAHYKFFFESVHDGKERTILLDLVFQELHYPKIIKKPIKAIYIETEDPHIEVQLLPIDCMLGDKLTAYAPNTCGIPYNINKDIEIIKQLYDISRLFGECSDLELIRETFKNSARAELDYSGKKDKGFEDVLEDIFQTSVKLAVRGKNRNIEKFNALLTGIRGFASYLSEKGFVIEDAILCSSHAAYLAQLIRKNGETKIKRFDHEEDLSKAEITGDLKYLNKLKKSAPEAFFYFKEAVEIYEKLNGK